MSVEVSSVKSIGYSVERECGVQSVECKQCSVKVVQWRLGGRCKVARM